MWHLLLYQLTFCSFNSQDKLEEVFQTASTQFGSAPLGDWTHHSVDYRPCSLVFYSFSSQIKLQEDYFARVRSAAQQAMIFRERLYKLRKKNMGYIIRRFMTQSWSLHSIRGLYEVLTSYPSRNVIAGNYVPLPCIPCYSHAIPVPTVPTVRHGTVGHGRPMVLKHVVKAHQEDVGQAAYRVSRGISSLAGTT